MTGAGLGRHHQTDVRIALVAVDPEFTTLVELHDFAIEAGPLLFLVGDFDNRRPLGLVHLSRFVARLNRLVHALRDVLKGLKLHQLQAGTRQLLVAALGKEAIGHQVHLRRGKLLQGAHHNVMIGEHQAIFRHKGAGTARAEADTGQLHMLEPLLIRAETILLLHALVGRIVQSPHSLIGHHGGRSE